MPATPSREDDTLFLEVAMFMLFGDHEYKCNTGHDERVWYFNGKRLSVNDIVEKLRAI